jgi:hypothetical protein
MTLQAKSRVLSHNKGEMHDRGAAIEVEGMGPNSARQGPIQGLSAEVGMGQPIWPEAGI